LAKPLLICFLKWPLLVYRWIVEAGAKVPEQEVSGEIKEMEFDERWYFIGSKKQTLGHQVG